MRNLRHVALTVLALGMMVPSLAAQSQEVVEDRWYWGGQAGVLLNQTIDASTGTIRQTTQTLTFGGHWLITKRRIGLYMAFDAVQFDNGTNSALPNPTSPTGFTSISFTNMHRIQASLLAMPAQNAFIQPYLGLGFALHNVTDAVPVLGTGSQAEVNFALERLPEQASRAFAVITGGLQIRTGRFAWFGTYQYMPASDQFLLVNAQHSFSGGLRFALSAASEEVGTEK